MSNTGTIDPKRGTRFLHSRIMNYDKTPALFEVTRVAQGRVWYRAVYDEGIAGSERLGQKECCDLDYFKHVCLASRA